MITTLFLYRDFTPADVDMAGLSLMAYALGLPGFMLIKVLAPAFYSRKDPRTPVRIAVIAMLANIVLNLLFVVPMVRLNIPGPHAGLALATSLAAWINAGLLYAGLSRRGIHRPRAGWQRFFLQIGLAGGLLAGVLYWGTPVLPEWIGRAAGDRVLLLTQWVGIGALLYVLVLRVCGLRLAALWQGREAA
jgi:putative peptidoglycan lipid II flippase